MKNRIKEFIGTQEGVYLTSILAGTITAYLMVALSSIVR